MVWSRQDETTRMLTHRFTIRIGGLKGGNKAIVCLSHFAPAMGPKQMNARGIREENRNH